MSVDRSGLKSPDRWLHWLDKTQWANTNRWHVTPNQCYENFTPDFKQLWFCASPIFLQIETLISKWNVKFIFIWKEDIEYSSSFLLSLNKTLLMLSLVQEWLDIRNVTLVAYFLDTLSSLSSRISFAWQYSRLQSSLLLVQLLCNCINSELNLKLNILIFWCFFLICRL